MLTVMKTDAMQTPFWTSETMCVATMCGWKLKSAESMKCMSFRAKGPAAVAAQASPEEAHGTISCVLGMHKHTSLSYMMITEP